MPIPSNDERQMQLRTIQSDDKTQYRVRFYHLANNVLRRENGTYTWSHPDRNSNSAKSKLSNIRGKICRTDFEHGKQLGFHTSKCAARNDPRMKGSMTANGITHTTEEATVCVCDLDKFVQVQLLKESPELLSLDISLCQEPLLV